MKKIRLMILCFALTAVLMVTGCNDGGTETNGEAPPEENGYEQVTGFVDNIYRQNGTAYLDVDCVQFFIGEEAVEEAKIDGNAEIDENGIYFVPNDHYIRWENGIRSYEISDDAAVKLCSIGWGSAETVSLDQYLEDYFFDEFKIIFLYHLILVDNVVVEIIEQYIP